MRSEITRICSKIEPLWLNKKRFLPKLQMDDTLQSASIGCGKKTLLEATMGKVLDQCRKLAWVCFSHLSLKSPNVIADEACPLLQPPPTSLLELAMVFVQQPAIFKFAQPILKKWHRQIFWSLDLFAEPLENSTNQRTASKESKNKFEHRLRKTLFLRRTTLEKRRGPCSKLRLLRSFLSQLPFWGFSYVMQNYPSVPFGWHLQSLHHTMGHCKRLFLRRMSYNTELLGSIEIYAH